MDLVDKQMVAGQRTLARLICVALLLQRRLCIFFFQWGIHLKIILEVIILFFLGLNDPMAYLRLLFGIPLLAQSPWISPWARLMLPLYLWGCHGLIIRWPPTFSRTSTSETNYQSSVLNISWYCSWSCYFCPRQKKQPKTTYPRLEAKRKTQTQSKCHSKRRNTKFSWRVKVQRPSSLVRSIRVFQGLGWTGLALSLGGATGEYWSPEGDAFFTSRWT